MSKNAFDIASENYAVGNYNVGLSETAYNEARQNRVPVNYSVSDWEQDEDIIKSFEKLTDYLAENQSAARYLYDQATTGQDDDPAEFMRDLTFRLGAPISLATSLKDAPEDVKAAYRTLKTKWDKATVTGFGEQVERILDYGGDLLFNPETAVTVAGLMSGFGTMGTGTAVTIATRKAAQVKAKEALERAVKSSFAAAANNPKTALMSLGTVHGAAGEHLAQELDIAADIKSEEDYSVGSTLASGALGAGFGLGLYGVGKLAGKGYSAYKSKFGNKNFRDDTNIDESLSVDEGSAAFEEVLEAEFIPASAGDLVDEALRLEGEVGDLKVILDGGDNALNRTVTQLADDLGGGEKTQEEIRRIIRTAAANETTRAGRQKSIQQQLYILSSRLTGNFFGKAAGILSPITKFSGTARQLQKKLSYEFGIKYKVQDEVVEKDLSEVQREITGKMNERFRAIVDTLSLSEIDTKFAIDINAALSKRLRSYKDIKFDQFDDVTNAAINKAAVEVKQLYAEMGKDLADIGVIDKLQDNYIPRMWSRSAIEADPEGLERLFVEKAGFSPAEAKRTVADMLNLNKQIDEGVGGGHFFSAKRKINTILEDADFEKYLNTDVLATLHAYTFQYGKSLSKHRVLGVKNLKEFESFWIPRIKEEMEANGQVFDNKMRKGIVNLYKTATGEGLDRFGRTAQTAVDTYSFGNRVALLGMATLSSLTEVFLNIAKGGVINSVKGFGEAIEQSHKMITKDMESMLMTKHGMTAGEALSEMRKFSIHVDQALNQVGDRLAGDELVTEGLQNASNKFFRLNLLDQWTKFVQTVSHSTGKNLIDENIKKLAIDYKNVPMDRKGEILAGELAELGIDYKKAVDWFNAGAKKTDDFYKNDFLGGAARYTNSVILQPTAMSGIKPMLYSNPKTSFMFQLLSYPAAFTNTVIKGAVKAIATSPSRNAAKIGIAGLIMTGMARWTNYVRTGGESERNKTQSEIIFDAIARWGGNGILLDSLERARESTKYTKSNVSYVGMPFGPIVSDAITMIQQGIIPTVGYKVPVLSGSYFGRQILGDDTVTRYRRGLRRTQDETFGFLTEQFPEAPKSLQFKYGGIVKGAKEAGSEVGSALTELFGKTKKPTDFEQQMELSQLDGDFVTTLTTATKGLIKEEEIIKTANNLEQAVVVKLNDGQLQINEYDAATLVDANILTSFNSRAGYLEDAEKSTNFQNAMNETNLVKAKGHLQEYQKELGYDDNQIFALKTIDEIEDTANNKDVIKDFVNSEAFNLKQAYDRISIKVSDEDIAKAEAAKFDDNTLENTHDFLTEVIKFKEPLISDVGAPQVATNAITKIAANGNVNFEKFVTPKINPEERPDMSLSDTERQEALESFVKGSDTSEKVYRSISSFTQSDYNISFVFSNEIGTHVGSKGSAETIKLRDALYDAIEKGAGVIYEKLKNQKSRLTQEDIDKYFDIAKSVADRDGRVIKDSVMQEGYISVKNPLLYDGETFVGNWKAVDILENQDASLELLANIERSGIEITRKLSDVLNPLRTRAKDIKARPEDNLEQSLEKMLMENELTIDFRKMLQDLGFDGIKYVNEIEKGFEGQSPFSYILFEPEQFKLVGSAKFDTKDPRHGFSAGKLVTKTLAKPVTETVKSIFAPKKESGFFSLAHKVALNLESSKAKPGQSFINQMKKQGVSDEELDWTGATEKFGNSKPVTKEEIVKHFEDTDFDFEILTGRPSKKEAEVTVQDDMPVQTADEPNEYEDFWEWVERNYPHEVDLADDVLEGAEWDEWYDLRFSEFKDKGQGDFVSAPKHLDFSFEGRETENYRELIFKLPERFKRVNRDYMHYHFPEVENPVMHIRLADIQAVEKAKRFDKNLLIDEIQADASQQAKTIKNERNTKQAYFTKEDEREFLNLTEQRKNILESVGGDIEEAQKIEGFFDREFELEQVSAKRASLIPDLPYKNERRWGLQGLRKGMIVAAEEGYDNLVLINGEIQAIRNRKKAAVTETILFKRDDGTFGLQGVLKGGDGVDDFMLNFQTMEEVEARLPKIIGEKNSKKLLSSTPDSEGTYTLKDDIMFKVGGQKFYDFYDKTLVKYLDTYFAKKYNTKITKEKYRRFDEIVELPTIKITDEMREDILKGLAMFAEGGYVIQKGDTLTKIAEEQGMTVQEIADINRIKNVDLIYVGDTLMLERPESEDVISEQAEKVQEAEPIVEPQPSMFEKAEETKESVLKTLGGATDEVVSSISTALSGATETVSETATKTGSILKKLLTMDFGSEGRTAENMTGATGQPKTDETPEPVEPKKTLRERLAAIKLQG